VDKAAPSRAFAKLVESEIRLGLQIQPGETCVDLGAAPGSWTYVALERGAKVIAIDRAPLRDDLMSHPSLTYIQGDAFAFEPNKRVDWLVCDVIAAPERCIELVLDWTRKKRCRQFVVTIKFVGVADLDAIQSFKKSLAAVCPGYFLQRLCANKNEACVFGSLEP
jgi:23S rRNA (cytidine2498-2'-O)-methyltransferase